MHIVQGASYAYQKLQEITKCGFDPLVHVPVWDRARGDIKSLVSKGQSILEVQANMLPMASIIHADYENFLLLQM